MRKTNLWFLRAFVAGAVTVPILMWLVIFVVAWTTTLTASVSGTVIISDVSIGMSLPSGGTLSLTGWKMMMFVAFCGGLLFCFAIGVLRVLARCFKARQKSN